MNSMPAGTPIWTPAFIRRHPALLVEWLRFRNSWSRWREQGARKRSLSLTFPVLLIAIVCYVCLSGQLASAIETLSDYRWLLAVIAALHAVTSVNRRRRHLAESISQSWLIATPIPAVSLRLSVTLRTLFPLFALIVAFVLILALAALTDEGTAAAIANVGVAAVGGAILGGAAGWWLGGRAKPSALEPSRYVPRPRISASMRPDSSALAGWPIAQVFAWSRPENSRYVLIAALMAVQGGSTAIAGLCVMAMYFLASYLAALLPAMLTVARSASDWLRATPITLAGFVWSVSRRALAHQLIGSGLAFACLVLLGAPPGVTLQIALLWFGLFVSISGLALVEAYRGRSRLVKIGLSVAALAALAAFIQMRAGART